MNYRIVEKESFTVVGETTTILLETKYVMLPRFWENCKADGTIGRLHQLGDGCTIMGIGENICVNGSFKYMIGVESEPVKNNSMQIMTIPKSTWIAFEPVLSEPQYVGPVWDYIFNDFLPNGKYIMASTPDLEINHKISEDRYTCEVWIPVVEKFPYK